MREEQHIHINTTVHYKAKKVLRIKKYQIREIDQSHNNSQN